MKQIPILKMDEEKQRVFGWASVSVRVNGDPVVDLQQDVIDTEVLEDAAYHYVLEFGTAGEMHVRGNVGKLIESVVFTGEKAQAMGIPQEILPQGWWVGYQIHDDDVWQKVRDGTYTMFSIEGTAIREEIEGRDQKKWQQN